MNALLAEARQTARLRKNLNVHDRPDHPCQRVLNAILPGSYVRPHRHLLENKEEFLVIVRGILGLIFFDADGAVTSAQLMEDGGSVRAMSIPIGVYHSAVALTPAVFFEAKAGPYRPNRPEEVAPFAPAEGSPQVVHYLRQMEALFTDA